MASPIRYDSKVEAVIRSQFDDWLKSEGAQKGGSFQPELKFKPETKPKIIFTPMAYLKLRFLMANFDKEVGFYGIVEKADEALWYTIHDIRVYPQKVTAATITTDEIELGAWYDSMGDEEFNHKRAHFHSHVNMSPTPSSTDQEDRRTKLADLENDDYFIFFIFNKSMKFSVDLYEMKSNTHYSGDDIEVVFPEDNLWTEIEKVSVTATAYQNYGNYGYGYGSNYGSNYGSGYNTSYKPEASKSGKKNKKDNKRKPKTAIEEYEEWRNKSPLRKEIDKAQSAFRSMSEDWLDNGGYDYGFGEE